MAVDGCSRHSRGSATYRCAENLQQHRTFWYLCAMRPTAVVYGLAPMPKESYALA